MLTLLCHRRECTTAGRVIINDQDGWRDVLKREMLSSVCDRKSGTIRGNLVSNRPRSRENEEIKIVMVAAETKLVDIRRQDDGGRNHFCIPLKERN